jgi:hypothetical protein
VVSGPLRAALSGLLLALALPSPTLAKRPKPPSPEQEAESAAAFELARGLPRELVLKNLLRRRRTPSSDEVVEGGQAALEALRNGVALASPELVAELRASIARERDPRKAELMNSRAPCRETAGPFYLKQLEEFASKNPADPAAPFIKRGKDSIRALLPLLGDRSPARSPCERFGGLPGMALLRTQDVALALIETIGRVEFSGRGFLSRLPEPERRSLQAQVQAWWGDCPGAPASCALAAQLARAEPMTRVQMAAQLWDAPKNPEDLILARETLEGFALEDPEHPQAAYAAAIALLERGDLRPLNDFTRQARESLELGDSGPDPYVLDPVIKYGASREWELILALAKRECLRGQNEILRRVGRLGDSIPKPARAVPVMALALDPGTPCGQESGSAYEAPDSMRIGWEAAALFLEKYAGEDFGYSRGGPEERPAAVERARKWWMAKGRGVYSRSPRE